MGATWSVCRTKAFLAGATGQKPSCRTKPCGRSPYPPAPPRDPDRWELHYADRTAIPDRSPWTQGTYGGFQRRSIVTQGTAEIAENLVQGDFHATRPAQGRNPLQAGCDHQRDGLFSCRPDRHRGEAHPCACRDEIPSPRKQWAHLASSGSKPPWFGTGFEAGKTPEGFAVTSRMSAIRADILIREESSNLLT